VTEILVNLASIFLYWFLKGKTTIFMTVVTVLNDITAKSIITDINTNLHFNELSGAVREAMINLLKYTIKLWHRKQNNNSIIVEVCLRQQLFRMFQKILQAGHVNGRTWGLITDFFKLANTQHPLLSHMKSDRLKFFFRHQYL